MKLKKQLQEIPNWLKLFALFLFSLTFIDIFWGKAFFHPLDARTGSAYEGVHLSLSWWLSWLEPLTAPLHIISTLPDIREGMVAILLWFFLGIFIHAFYNIKKQYGIKKTVITSSKILAWFIYLLIFYLLIPLPNPSLNKEKKSLIIADLHSHNLLSHDGVVTLKDNLSIHQQRGYNLVALTNHANLEKAVIDYQAAYANSPEAVPGMEIPVYYGGHFYLSVLGMEKGTPLPNGLAWYEGNKTPLPPASLPDHLWSVKKLIRVIHKHGGVVAVVALHLDIKEVQNLAQVGVDAFEIVNFGHHSLHQDVRQAMLQAQKERGIALIASNDWHGWTGVLNTWTLIQADPLLKDESLEVQVMDALKHHGQKVIPLTAYPIHNMTIQEMIFA
ncbi:MAG: hypothetical protein Q9M18_04155, partial [Mariprofundaceae bacterium]|nr:hypothetical protein [Mariprofundaceae bacterium]